MRWNAVLTAALLSLCIGATTADAGCQGRKTTGTVIGAGAGGVLGNAVTHGSVVGTLGGAALGGFAGHRIASDNCHKTAYSHHYRHYSYRNGRRGYYDREGRWHYA